MQKSAPPHANFLFIVDKYLHILMPCVKRCDLETIIEKKG